MSYAAAIGTPRRRLTREDLLGCDSISYLRFSSSGQEKGSTIDRQVEVRDALVSYFELKLDRTLEDRALSASKGHHRKRGNLSILLAAARRGDFQNKAKPTVLIIEAMDRLFREGIIDVSPILSEMIKKGLVIVTGDRTIWCETLINGSENHKLIAEINAGKLYAERLAEFARGAHARRRKSVDKLAADPTAEHPELNGRTPGWLIKLDKPNTSGLRYELHPEFAPVIVRIFEMCASGAPVRVIAETLNREGVPTLPWTTAAKGEWRAPRIGAILRDRHVLGFYTPMQWQEEKRIDVGPEVRVFPPAVSAELWMRAKAVLDGRTMLIGRKGVNVPMLFSRHAFCGTCGGALRCDTGGGIRRRQKVRTMVCARYVESKTCQDRTRYDLNYFESPILSTVLEITSLAPKRPTDGAKLVDDLAVVQIEIERLKERLKVLAEGITATTRFLLDEPSRTLEVMVTRAAELKLLIEATASGCSRLQDTFTFCKQLVGPALGGDIEARERLRSLLVKLDYRISGAPHSGLIVTSGSRSKTIDPEHLVSLQQVPPDDHRHPGAWEDG